MPEPQMEMVSSSNVESIGYDESERELWVRFLSGSTYVYIGVDPTTCRLPSDRRLDDALDVADGPDPRGELDDLVSAQLAPPFEATAVELEPGGQAVGLDVGDEAVTVFLADEGFDFLRFARHDIPGSGVDF